MGPPCGVQALLDSAWREWDEASVWQDSDDSLHPYVRACVCVCVCVDRGSETLYSPNDRIDCLVYSRAAFNA